MLRIDGVEVYNNREHGYTSGNWVPVTKELENVISKATDTSEKTLASMEEAKEISKDKNDDTDDDGYKLVKNKRMRSSPGSENKQKKQRNTEETNNDMIENLFTKIGLVNFLHDQ